MRKISRTLIKGIAPALAAGLVLFGFNACNDNNDDDGIVICYASSADYVIKGNVVNNAGEAIPGIQIEVITFPGEYSQRIDTTYTDASGGFDWMSDGLGAGEPTFHVIATDIDGGENGSYLTDTTYVAFKREELIGRDDSYYFGKAEKDTTFVMKATELQEPI